MTKRQITPDEASSAQLLREADEKFIRDRERFVQAVWGRLSPEENEQAWREFSDLAARVFKKGRLWSAERVWCLVPFFRLIEEDMLRAEEGLDGNPSLEMAERLAAFFDRPVDEPRRIAGYLSADAQPAQALSMAT